LKGIFLAQILCIEPSQIPLPLGIGRIFVHETHDDRAPILKLLLGLETLVAPAICFREARVTKSQIALKSRIIRIGAGETLV
jgi:hypothetical protein